MTSTKIIILLLATFIGIFLNLNDPNPGKPITELDFFVNLDALPASPLAETLISTFHQSAFDQLLSEFLASSAQASSPKPFFLLLYVKTFIFNTLMVFGWNRPDASGLAKMTSPYVASTNQFKSLFSSTATSFPTPTLLDYGSGTGTETAKLASALDVLHDNVFCVETSPPLRRVLRSRGFQAAVSPPPPTTVSKFSTVSMLNVLDSCDNPHGLLSNALKSVSENGTILIGIVMPFRAQVYEGRVGSTWGKATSRPPGSPFKLPLKQKEPTLFETRVLSFLETLLREHPRLQLGQWTRLPYVSLGDLTNTHYVLNMAVMVFRVENNITELEEAVTEQKSVTRTDEDVKMKMEMKMEMEMEMEIPVACQDRKDDKIFAWLASTLTKLNPSQSWGDVLDAGSGFDSLCWLLRQKEPAAHKITAVTAASNGTYGSDDLINAVASLRSVAIEVGNWRNPLFLKGLQYDVIVADYLLGAVERYWPHGADGMMNRLLNATKPGGYLLITSLEPYENILDRKNNKDKLVLNVESIGEAAAYIAGESTYREVPLSWILRQIDRFPEYQIVTTKEFPMTLTSRSLLNQISYARATLKKIEDTILQTAFLKRVAALEKDIKKKWKSSTHMGTNNAIIVQRGYV